MIQILRLGHRIERDKRISTHVFLVGRAFGASKGIYSGQKDKKLENSINKTVKQWGGNFQIKHTPNWRTTLKNWSKSGRVLHLTAYGTPMEKKITEIRKFKDIMVIVGGRKVPSEVYRLADWNLSVTNQPHSEVAALSVFLHDYFQGKELNKKFSGGKLRIIPRERGKKVLKT